MLFQRDGNLQVQVRATVNALNGLPPLSSGARIEAELVDPFRSRLDDYDVVHVFAAVNGNHRIVEEAARLHLPVVLSALVAPGWTRSDGTRARIADRLLGNLIGADVQTSYAQIRQALQLASLVVAQGEPERQAIHTAFLINPAKVRVLPNGVSPHFFDADPALFRSRTAVKGKFALMVGPVSPYKCQLGMAQVLSEMALPFVVIGEALERDADYLRQLRAVPGVICMGALHQQQRMLASAYAAAAVFVLPGRGEPQPQVVLEALAAGTPVVIADESGLVLPHSEFALRMARWNDRRAQKSALLELLDEPPQRERVRALVRSYTWENVALQLADCYADAQTLARRANCALAPADAGIAAHSVPR